MISVSNQVFNYLLLVLLDKPQNLLFSVSTKMLIHDQMIVIKHISLYNCPHVHIQVVTELLPHMEFKISVKQ